jgi:hypothetical protein
MFRFTLFLILASAASAQPQAADILNKVRETYSHLNAIHVVAKRIDAITRGVTKNRRSCKDFVSRTTTKWRC